jgi:hypothetical protein
MIIYLTKHPQVLDPETIRDVLDTAWESVRAGSAQFDGRAGEARNVLAKRVVDLAFAGRARSSAANRRRFGAV